MPPHEIDFDVLWPAATAWAEEQGRKVVADGRLLTGREIALAMKVGVRRPDLVNVLVVPTVPIPTDGIMGDFFAAKGLNQGDWWGLTVGYSVFLRTDIENTPTVAHELRHVAQFEAFGSVQSFTFFYLKELLHFGYSDGPLERDAKQAENEFQ